MLKRGGGKPRWLITPERIADVEKYAALGLTKEQIAYNMGITYKTLNEKSKEDSEFCDAIKRGQAKGIQIVANALFNNAINGNTVAQIFFLKARAKWCEQDVINIEDAQKRIQDRLQQNEPK